MTFTRPPAADCRGGKAGDACSTNRRTGSRTEGRDAFTKRRFSVLQNDTSPQPDGVGDSEGIVVGLCEIGGLTGHRSVCKRGGCYVGYANRRMHTRDATSVLGSSASPDARAAFSGLNELSFVTCARTQLGHVARVIDLQHNLQCN